MDRNQLEDVDMEYANEHYPGPQSETAGKSDSCTGCPNQEACATAPKGPDPDLVAIAERMAIVKHKILVFSCKGGVGKSTFSAQLSFALAGMDYQVGLMDIDICGPSIPKMLGLQRHDIHRSKSNLPFGLDPDSDLAPSNLDFLNRESNTPSISFPFSSLDRLTISFSSVCLLPLSLSFSPLHRDLTSLFPNVR